MELLERLAALEAAVAARDARITALEAENAELRCRLGQSPRNSNMPPEDFISSLAGATQILRLETHGVCALICVAEINDIRLHEPVNDLRTTLSILLRKCHCS
ncbi:MAG: hypothetical protein QOH97_4254 [Actinoplanes sp.]|jgi:hypothetical protein|nr:hypothetical protein [Actinoplanes sp.]